MQFKSLRAFLFCSWVAALPFSYASQAQIIDKQTFNELATKCAPEVSVDTMSALVKVESGFNPLAIAIVGGSSYYPRTKADALKTIADIKARHLSFSLGLGQINDKNFDSLGVSAADLLNPCTNLTASSKILKSCFIRAKQALIEDDLSLQAALSCYYSGNFTTGIKEGYVHKVISNPKPLIPSLSILQLTLDQKPDLPLLNSPDLKHGLML